MIQKSERGLEPERVSKPRSLLCSSFVKTRNQQDRFRVFERNGKLVFTRNSEGMIPKNAPVRLPNARLEEPEYGKLSEACSSAYLSAPVPLRSGGGRFCPAEKAPDEAGTRQTANPCVRENDGLRRKKQNSFPHLAPGSPRGLLICALFQRFLTRRTAP